MNTKKIQNFSDRVIERLFFRFIPEKIKPNHFTYVRIILVPVIFFLMRNKMGTAAFFVFIFAACTDFIDGALARKRNQITELGKVIDPLADKMLIAVALIFIGYQYLVVRVFLIFIALEIIAVLGSIALSRYIGKPIGASAFGKIKMIIQSIAIIFFFLGFILKIEYFISVSIYLLFVALFFAALSAFDTGIKKIEFLRKEKIIP